jgi:HD-like signal output (HDOD) protein
VNVQYQDGSTATRKLKMFKKVIMNAIDYAKKVSDLFAVPKTAVRVKSLIDDDRSDANSISAVLQTDPGLAAHILKLANSAIYRFPRKIDKLQRAIQVIGTSAVYDYALVFGLSNAFSKEQSQFVDLDKFWEQSVSCAILAKHFAISKGIKDPDRLFVNGLLHNIGEQHWQKIVRVLMRNSIQKNVSMMCLVSLTLKFQQHWCSSGCYRIQLYLPLRCSTTTIQRLKRLRFKLCS